MATLTVGPGRDYSTITLALAASHNNDVVLIDPGYYDEFVSLPQWSVHLLGRNADSENTDIIIKSIKAASFTSHTTPITYIMENIYIYRVGTAMASVANWNFCYATLSSSNIITVFNRCKFYIKDTLNSYNVFEMTIQSSTYCYLYVINCDYFRDHEIIHYFYDYYTTACTNCRAEYIKLRYTLYGVSRNNADVVDYVIGPAVGYGAGYGGKFLNLPKSYVFTGRVTTLGASSSNVVRAYRKNNHTYEGYTSSDQATGNYTLRTTYSGAHQLICESVPDPLFSDKIISPVVPAVTTPTTLWDETGTLIATISGAEFTSQGYGLPVFIYFKNPAGKNTFDTSIILDELDTQTLRKRWSVWSSEEPYQLCCEVLYWQPESNLACATIKLPYIYTDRDTNLYIRYDKNISDNVAFMYDTESPYSYSVYTNQYLGAWTFNQDPVSGPNSLIDNTFNKKHGIPVGTFYSADLVDSPTGKAWQFNGAQYVYTSDTNLLGYNAGNWSIMAAFNVSTTSGVQIIDRVGLLGGGFELGVDANVLYAIAGYQLTQVQVTCTGISPDIWYVATAVCNKTTSTLSLYLDGALVSSATNAIFSGNILYSNSNYIGGAATSIHYFPKLSIPTVPSGTLLHITCSGVEGHPYLYDSSGNYTITKYNLTGAPGNITAVTSKVGNESYHYNAAEYFSTVLDSKAAILEQDFSVSFWFYYVDSYNSGYDSVFMITGAAGVDTAANSTSLAFFVQYNSDEFWCRIRTNTGTTIATFNFGNVSYNSWVHYAIYRKGTLFYVKKDGELFSSVSYTTVDINWTGKNVFIGHTLSSYWWGYLDSIIFTVGSVYEPTQEELERYKTYLNGKIDFIHHVGRALTSDEVKLISNSYKDTLFTFSS